MVHLRFNHVFLLLMGLAAASAFVVAPRVTAGVRASAGALFAPLAGPLHWLSGWTAQRIAPPPPDRHSPAQPRTQGELLAENDRLRQDLASLTAQMERLQQREAERSRLGPLRQRVSAATVVGQDAGPGESLAVLTGGVEDVAPGTVALYGGGVAGRVDRAGVGSAQVRLLTDPRSRLLGGFARFERDAAGAMQFVRLATDPLPVQGAGDNRMQARFRLQPLIDAGVRPGDWVVLNDPEWPEAVLGARIGLVREVQTRSQPPGFALVWIEPERRLTLLREVLLLNRP